MMLLYTATINVATAAVFAVGIATIVFEMHLLIAITISDTTNCCC